MPGYAIALMLVLFVTGLFLTGGDPSIRDAFISNLACAEGGK